MSLALYLGEGGHASLCISCQCARGVRVELPVLASKDLATKASFKRVVWRRASSSAWDCLYKEPPFQCQNPLSVDISQFFFRPFNYYSSISYYRDNTCVYCIDNVTPIQLQFQYLSHPSIVILCNIFFIAICFTLSASKIPGYLRPSPSPKLLTTLSLVISIPSHRTTIPFFKTRTAQLSMLNCCRCLTASKYPDR